MGLGSAPGARGDVTPWEQPRRTGSVSPNGAGHCALQPQGGTVPCNSQKHTSWPQDQVLYTLLRGFLWFWLASHPVWYDPAYIEYIVYFFLSFPFPYMLSFTFSLLLLPPSLPVSISANFSRATWVMRNSAKNTELSPIRAYTAHLLPPVYKVWIAKKLVTLRSERHNDRGKTDFLQVCNVLLVADLPILLLFFICYYWDKQKNFSEFLIALDLTIPCLSLWSSFSEVHIMIRIH